MVSLKTIRFNYRFCVVILFVSAISSLRSLVIPLVADEITYSNISENILKGQYYLNGNPSTIAPTIPFLFALFKFTFFPKMAIIFHKLFNLGLVILGFRYLYMFLLKLNLSRNIIWIILALTAVNPTSVAWFSTLYPEGLIFFCFWGFIFYASKKPKSISLIKLLFFFTLLVLTRYVYAILGLVLLITYYEYLKFNFNKYKLEIVKYSVVFLIPILLWGKYILNVENEGDSGISYFKRFKVENPILYNVKCGLGIEKHYEVNKINGLPAFVSLFIPKTGIRNYLISVLLIIAFAFGLLNKIKLKNIKKIVLSILLIMLGFIFAGTGFSRYWLVLLPGFILGYYYFFKSLRINDKWFIYLSQIISVIYVINEIRLDLIIINRYI